jgi:hypothetical protein
MRNYSAAGIAQPPHQFLSGRVIIDFPVVKPYIWAIAINILHYQPVPTMTNLRTWCFLVMLGGLLVPPPVSAQDIHKRFQITPYFALDGYRWKEFGDTGDELLTESGLLFGLGLRPKVSFGSSMRFFLDAEFEYWFGSVDYEGFIQGQNGVRTPYTTTTVYGGIDFSLKAGYKFPVAKSFDLTPAAGFGYQYWNRNLDNGGKNGYDEQYSVFLLDLGVTGLYQFSRPSQGYLTLLLEMPVSISESIDLASRGQGGPANISLSPGTSPAFQIRLGGSFYNVFVEGFFRTWLLTKSNEDQGYHQPESTQKKFGVRLGYVIGVI